MSVHLIEERQPPTSRFMVKLQLRHEQKLALISVIGAICNIFRIKCCHYTSTAFGIVKQRFQPQGVSEHTKVLVRS